jgi:hypothetical protein
MTKQPTKAFLKVLAELYEEHAFYDIRDGTVYQTALNTPYDEIRGVNEAMSLYTRWILGGGEYVIAKAEEYGWD